MSIISGQDSRLQIGLANTWRSPTRAMVRLPYTQEGFKGTPNYKEAEALVGASGTTSMAIMSFKADGSFTTYVTPDLAKILFYAALGYEYAQSGPDANGQYEHKFVPISAGACANLPSLTCEVDRLQEKGIYLNYKMTDWKLSGKAEDYIMFESSGPAFKEDIQSVLAQGIVMSNTATTRVVTLPAGVISADNEHVGRVARFRLECGEPVYGLITASAAVAHTITLAASLWTLAFPVTLNELQGYTCEILDWEMQPNIPISQLEYMRFVHGYLYMDKAVTPYKALPTGAGSEPNTGALGDTVVDVPLAVTGLAGHELYIEAVDPKLVTRVFKYVGVGVITRTTLTTLTFSALTTDGMIPAITFDANGVLTGANWEIAEDMYDEVTEFTLSGDNKIGESQFGMNGSMFSSEVNPTSRSFSLDLSSRFTTKFSRLRRDRMMAGVPMSIRLEFITKLADGPLGEQDTSVDSTGHPYRIVVDMKKAYYIEGGANISGPDEPTISPKFTLAETPGVHKAIEVSIFDDVNSKASTVTYAVLAREDGYVG